ncbi:hypothetical protein ACXYRK_00705 [Mycoplasma sp. AC1221]
MFEFTLMLLKSILAFSWVSGWQATATVTDATVAETAPKLKQGHKN